MPHFATSRFLTPLLLVLGLTVIGLGCDVIGSDNSDLTLSGRVLNSSTMDPVEDAVVTIRFTEDGEEEESTVVTDSVGYFSTSLDISTSLEVSIAASKEGVSAEKIKRVSPDLDEVDEVQIELELGAENDEKAGDPTNVTLSGQSTDAIRVQESGGEEVASLSFQVVDSTGTPIGIDQSVDLSFRFGEQPGDAKLTPKTVTTDGEGTGTVNVISGTTAGVVQVVAEAEKEDGTLIHSKPISLTIHGGLPNKCHFTVTAEQSNFAGLVEHGLTNSITAILGDKYGNPVIPETSVYFTTNAGIIDGSMQTDEAGMGSVTLTSAQPEPSGGVATIRMETVGTDDLNTIVDPNNCPDPAQTGNENRITEIVPVVFSGRTEVEISPTSAQVGETYELRLSDAGNDNPLAPGTSISVEAEGTNVQATGNTEITLDDTTIREGGDGGWEVVTGEGITDFTFHVAEGDGDKSPVVETITVSIDSPNGSSEVVLTQSGRGTTSSAKSKQAIKTTEGASVRMTGSETASILAPTSE